MTNLTSRRMKVLREVKPSIKIKKSIHSITDERMEHDNSDIGVRISITFMAVAFFGAIYFLLTKSDEPTASSGWVAAFIAIANALLLYSTLQSQNKGIEIQKESAERERFETTFFNLLKSHRQIVNEINVYRSSVAKNDISKVTFLKFSGRQFFTFALIDINNISNNIKKKKFTKYDIESAAECEEYLANLIENPYERINVESKKKTM